ncbi:hypothetical protein GOV09_00085 [Candidatus Woesearchaeota archaeon]|nr:hypothetical protein [Candidatus Woesearchaeota archaeon]
MTDFLATILPGGWKEAPDTLFWDICYWKDTDYYGACREIRDYSGPAWDATRNQFLARGGGHGTEWPDASMYSFDVDELQWAIVDPATDPFIVGDAVYQANGQPSSYHTYGTTVHVSIPEHNIDHYYAFGMPYIYNPGSGLSAPHTNVFDMNAKTWEQKTDNMGGASGMAEGFLMGSIGLGLMGCLHGRN